MAPGPTEKLSNPKKKDKVDLKSDLNCRVKYCNTLPDLPFDPKFLKYPFDERRFIRYNPTTLEKSFKFDIFPEHDLDLGKNLDYVILPENYAPSRDAELAEEDGRLLAEDESSLNDNKRGGVHKRHVSWLRKTEYISTEYNRFTPQNKKTETSVGRRLQEEINIEVQYKSREDQLAAIEKTFEAAKVPINEHYAKAGVTCKKVYPVLPDFSHWKYPFAQVLFDSDPTRKCLPDYPPTAGNPQQQDELSHAVIKGMADETGEQFVGYFLPAPDTFQKKLRLDEEGLTEQAFSEEYEYEMVREYNWSVKNKSSKGYEEDYFFVVQDDGVYYNELETKVRLSKRKRKFAQMNRTFLMSKMRWFNPNEKKVQLAREMMLASVDDEVGDKDEDDEAVGGHGDDDDDDNMEDVEGNMEDQAEDDDDDNDDDKVIHSSRPAGAVKSDSEEEKPAGKETNSSALKVDDIFSPGGSSDEDEMDWRCLSELSVSSESLDILLASLELSNRHLISCILDGQRMVGGVEVENEKSSSSVDEEQVEKEEEIEKEEKDKEEDIDLEAIKRADEAINKAESILKQLNMTSTSSSTSMSTSLKAGRQLPKSVANSQMKGGQPVKGSGRGQLAGSSSSSERAGKVPVIGRRQVSTAASSSSSSSVKSRRPNFVPAHMTAPFKTRPEVSRPKRSAPKSQRETSAYSSSSSKPLETERRNFPTKSLDQVVSVAQRKTATADRPASSTRRQPDNAIVPPASCPSSDVLEESGRLCALAEQLLNSRDRLADLRVHYREKFARKMGLDCSVSSSSPSSSSSAAAAAATTTTTTTAADTDASRGRVDFSSWPVLFLNGQFAVS